MKKYYPWIWFDADGTLFDYNRAKATALKNTFDSLTLLFERTGHPAKSDVLIIGDSLTSDIQGGVDYGIDTCWYNPTGEPRPEGLPITYEIPHLRELLDFLV